MEKDTFKTKVIFRKFKTGEIVAVFYEIVNYLDGSIESYMHIGQHGPANYNHIIRITKKATKSEYDSLYNELTKLGYNLDVRQKKHNKPRI